MKKSHESKLENRAMNYDAHRDFLWLLLRPWILVPRIIYIVFTLFIFTLRFLLQGNSKDKVIQRDLAIYLLKTITNLGPCFIKLGQALSTRPDLVKQEWLDELTNLQDNLPAFDHNLAKDIFKSEIGKSVNEVFKYFPNESKIKDLLHSNHFTHIEFQKLTFGIATIYKGIKD